MPNGADVPGGTGIIPLLTVGVKAFVAELFGGGGGAPFVNPQAPVPSGFTPSGKFEGFIDVRTGLPPTEQVLFGAERGNIFLQRALVRAPIPTPAEGGPPLVTERFAQLPGPFVDPGLGILPFELRDIPEDPTFIPRQIPEPDVLEDEDMAVDAPLLAGFSGFLPAVRQAASPTIGAIAGGLISDILPGLFTRAPQEMGLGQVPAPQRGGLPRPFAPENGERPSTRILRQIRAATGVRIKLTSAKALIRQLGLQMAANCLRISITDACTLAISPSPRRRRGISGSDIRIVKRTARRFQALQQDLSGLGSRRRAAPRRRRHVHAIQHTAPAP